MNNDQSRTFEITDRVHGLNLGLDGTLSSFVVVDEEPTLIDAGTASAVNQIVEGLKSIGISPRDLSNIVVSHIHLDHSGAAAGLADLAKDLDVYVHESTAHHLVDPTKLIRSSKKVLGDEFEKLGAPNSLTEEYIVPVPDDGVTIDCGQRTLNIVHTPGHSPDHVSVLDQEADIAFANEAIGRYYSRTDCWVPPVTIPQFDIEGVYDAINLLQSFAPEIVAFSHARTLPAEETFSRAEFRMDKFTSQIPVWFDETGDFDETVRRVCEELLTLADGYPEDVVKAQADICTQGILDYYDKV